MKGRKRETGGSVCHISYSIFSAKFAFADMYEKKAKINQRLLRFAPPLYKWAEQLSALLQFIRLKCWKLEPGAFSSQYHNQTA